MAINTMHLERCLQTLESSLAMLAEAQPKTIDYEVFRNAVIKGFELTLETSGKLMRKAVKAYGGSPKTVDELVYKDVVRHAAKRGLLDDKAAERWFSYRDNRNDTAHDYGESFAEETLVLMPGFLDDVRALILALKRLSHA